ncbi:MAG: PadR family transcriptional regulator [Tetrasphaera sp.]
MTNESTPDDIPDFDDDFPFGPGHRGGRRGPHGPHERRRHRGGRGPSESGFENFFGPDGPLGPRGPFGPGGLFGREGAEIARSLWEAATSGSTPPAPNYRGTRDRDGEHDHDNPWAEVTDHPRGERRRRGPGPEARGRRGGGRGGRRGRRPRGDVRLAALLLIAEEPRNGYQVIEELVARTGGAWRPSSGAVYPALAQLEDEGLIEAFDNDGRKAFRLTDTGRDAAAAAQDAPRPWETATEEASEALGGRQSSLLWQSFGQVAMATKAVAATKDEATVAEAARLLEQTRRSLYRLLADGPQDATGPQFATGPQDATGGEEPTA